jgi:hypothetical protein
MSNNKIPKKLAILFLIPLGATLVNISSKRPELVEMLYSEGIYQPIGSILSRASGILPFSVAELVVILVPAAFILYTIKTLMKTISRRRVNLMPLLKYTTNILVIISISFFVFLSVWGLNYYRMPFASIAGLEIKPAPAAELENVCKALIERANALRSSVNTDKAGNMNIPGNSLDILNSCYKGYEVIARRYPELAGIYGNPKPVLLSRLMNYTGICGIYFPFTGEANVNVSVPDSILPSTAAHEMAHQRGFSREDEANYISYLSCTSHPDVNFKYSGVLLALTNSMNALYRINPSSFISLSENYSDGIRHDLAEIDEFWNQYKGPVERTTDKINDKYLKANNQKDGVRSYGRMVDLLIAEYRQADRY